MVGHLPAHTAVCQQWCVLFLSFYCWVCVLFVLTIVIYPLAWVLTEMEQVLWLFPRLGQQQKQCFHGNQQTYHTSVSSQRFLKFLEQFCCFALFVFFGEEDFASVIVGSWTPTCLCMIPAVAHSLLQKLCLTSSAWDFECPHQLEQIRKKKSKHRQVTQICQLTSFLLHLSHQHHHHSRQHQWNNGLNSWLFLFFLLLFFVCSYSSVLLHFSAQCRPPPPKKNSLKGWFQHVVSTCCDVLSLFEWFFNFASQV